MAPKKKERHPGSTLFPKVETELNKSAEKNHYSDESCESVTYRADHPAKPFLRQTWKIVPQNWPIGLPETPLDIPVLQFRPGRQSRRR